MSDTCAENQTFPRLNQYTVHVLHSDCSCMDTLHAQLENAECPLILVLPGSVKFIVLHAQQLNRSGTICVAWLENVGFAICVLHDHVFVPEKY